VDAHFAEKKIISTGNGKLFFKNILIVCALIGIYTLLVFFTPHAVISVFLAAVAGMCLAMIGFNIMHEGAHQSISRHKWMNSLSAYSLNMMGGNSHFWKLKHNISHHTFTNISGEDHDINLGVFLRLDVNQKRRWFHKYQHIYWIGLYAITYLAWVLFQDFQKYFTGRMAPGAAEKHTFALKEHLIFWITKVLYLSVYIAVPVLIVGWIQTLVGFLVAGIVCGLFISIVFQMAHSVEIADFRSPT
jgi:linoleoyl-CoA desaturase